MALVRKCEKCKQEIELTEDILDEVVYFNKKTYHVNCFIEELPKKLKSHSEKTQKIWSKAPPIEKLQKDSKAHYLTCIYKDDLYNFIRDQYDMTTVPEYVWIKLTDISQGTYKGMSEGIPPETLLDMWRRKMEYLNKTYAYNKSRGKAPKTAQERVVYDLAVLVAKYDSYKAFLEKQKIFAVEVTQKADKDKTARLTSLVVAKEEPSAQPQQDDMSDLVDEIFS